MTWISILGMVSIWIILLPLLIGAYRFKNLNKESRIIFTVVLIGTIPQVLRSFLYNTSILTILYNLYTPLEFILYFLLFKYKSGWIITKKILIYSFFIFAALSAFFIFTDGLEKRFLNEWVIVNNTFQMIWVCFCLTEYYKFEDLQIETNQPFFWFLAGITIYATCTVTFYALWYFVQSDSKGSAQLIKIIHHIFNILLYLFFSIGILKNYRRDTVDL